MAGAGPMPMISGGTPTAAPAMMRASGAALPFAGALSRRATTTAAAPSTMAELLPPVCTPLNAGLSDDRASSVVGRGCSSSSSAAILRGRRISRVA